MKNTKLYYNSEGWVCNRYPYDLPIDNFNTFIMVDQDMFNETLCVDLYHAWRVVDGNLLVDQYEPIP